MRHTAGKWVTAEKLEVRLTLDPAETRRHSSDALPPGPVDVVVTLDTAALRVLCAKALRSASGRATDAGGALVIKGRLPKAATQPAPAQEA